MNREEEIVQEKMRYLIATSCRFENLPTEQFSNFHKVFMKFAFRAVDVRIDYGNKQICISYPKPLTTDPVRLFDMKDAIADKFSYTNLEETLDGCLQSGQLQTTFYKKLLSEYGDHTNDDSDFLSA